MTAYLGRDLEAMSAAVGYHREILDTFAPYLGKHVVEVGAGTGNVSVLILEREPVRLCAIEPDDDLYAKLAQRLKSHSNAVVRHGLLSSVVDREGVGEADSVVSVNVLEHVEDDVTELALMRSVLRPGGHLCLWVPAMPALYSNFDRSLGHHRRYRRRELAKKLEKAGLETLQIDHRDILGMVAWFVNCRIMRQELTYAKVCVYERCVLPVTSLLDRRLKPPIGKNLIAVARNP